MPPPSQLAIATGSVTRLVKEESTYHTELAEGGEQLKRLEEKLKSGEPDEDGNAEFLVRQQRTSVQQTLAVFKPLRERLEAAVAKLTELVEAEEKTGGGSDLENAKAALASAKEALSKSA